MLDILKKLRLDIKSKKETIYCIESFVFSNGNLELYGWLFNQKSKPQKIFFEVNKKTLLKPISFQFGIERTDIFSAYKLKSSLKCGFFAKFDFKNLSFFDSYKAYIQLNNNEIIKITQITSFFIFVLFSKHFINKYYSHIKFIFNQIKLFGYINLFNLLNAELKTIYQIIIFNKKKLAHRESILIISHDLSRTGAPILALNLVEHFRSKYNVILLTHREGSLKNDFDFKCSLVVISELSRFNTKSAHLFCSFLMTRLNNKFNFKFIIANSIESRHSLSHSARNFIPSIHLIHEFSAYTRPLGAFPQAVFWSDIPVFSSFTTYKDFIKDYPFAQNSSYEIITQGHCSYLGRQISNSDKKLEEKKLNNILNVENKNIIRIIGAGFVQYRKGVDLFIDIAAMILKESKAELHFYWIGDGYNWESEGGYAAYIKNQIYQHNIQNKITFINATKSYKFLLGKCDIFLLSSRLDPFPNVAIDAIYSKIPVLCFNNATGFSDFLKNTKFAKYCVADYLNLVDLKNKLNLLIKSRKLRNTLGTDLYNHAKQNLNFSQYAIDLENLAKHATFLVNKNKESFLRLIAAKAINRNYSFPLSGNYHDATFFYVKSWRKKFYMRKPFPGFHPGIYSEAIGLHKDANGIDPLDHYLLNNKPAGPWNYPVITFNDVRLNNYAKKTALHIHVYYLELFEQIIDRLSLNNSLPDLYLSISENSQLESVRNISRGYKGAIKAIKVFPNVGRNLGPFLLEFLPLIFNRYEFIGHLHTKKSIHLNNNLSETWNNFILDNLLGVGSKNMMDVILLAMSQDSSIGLVFPDDPNAQGWDQNFTIAKNLAKKMGIIKLPHSFIFPVGSMFWAKCSALAPLLNLKLQSHNFPSEPIDNDGTILHAIERLFPFVVQKAGFKLSTCYLEGTSR